MHLFFQPIGFEHLLCVGHGDPGIMLSSHPSEATIFPQGAGGLSIQKSFLTSLSTPLLLSAYTLMGCGSSKEEPPFQSLQDSLGAESGA